MSWLREMSVCNCAWGTLVLRSSDVLGEPFSSSALSPVAGTVRKEARLCASQGWLLTKSHIPLGERMAPGGDMKDPCPMREQPHRPDTHFLRTVTGWPQPEHSGSTSTVRQRPREAARKARPSASGWAWRRDAHIVTAHRTHRLST